MNSLVKNFKFYVKALSQICFFKKFLGSLFGINAIKNFRSLIKSYGLALMFLVFVVLALPQSDANASMSYGVERIRTCNNQGQTSGMEWDPSTGGKDIDFVLTNPVCDTVILTMYTPVKIAIAAMNKICSNFTPIRATPSIMMDLIDVARCTRLGIANGSLACGAAIVTANAAIGVAVAQLSLVYGLANEAYQNTHICGYNWYGPNPGASTRTSPNYKAQLQQKIEGYMRASSEEQARRFKLDYDDRPEHQDADDYAKEYREWYYGGVEFRNDSCKDPTMRNYDPNNNYPAQRYYLKGLEAGNYNCKKYRVFYNQPDPFDGHLLDSGNEQDRKRKEHLDQAYECCRARAREYICIQNHDDNKFCRAGDKCTFTDDGKHYVTFEATSEGGGTLVCAQSYSLCPYNFSIDGGTQYCDPYRDGKLVGGTWHMITANDLSVDEHGNLPNCGDKSEIRNDDCTLNDKASRCRNYCQYLTHCTTTSSADYTYNTSITSPYFSDACLNFVGDSQNFTSFNGGIAFGSQRHFSAPIVQCTKETLENLFYNKAGHTECVDIVNDPVNSGGKCSSGIYAYKKGDDVDKVSLFASLQHKLQGAVKMVIVLSVMFYGMNILMGKADIREKKDILMFLVKIGLVLYFATGNAWQTQFFDGVYNSSAAFAKIVFKISTNDDPAKQDGCQFGMITRSDGSQYSSDKNGYPSGKEYLAMWDTLDCKIVRYLGFGPEVSTANIVSLIFAGFFTKSVGVYFSIALSFLGIFFVVLTVRMLHIFLSSVISIILMVFVSPIVIPTVMFQRTGNIFKSWLTNLISFCLQPMFLFAYIAILVMVIDKSLIGSATFHGPGPFKTISCSSFCQQDNNGAVISHDDDPDCVQKGHTLIDPMTDSVACLVSSNSFGNFPGFEIIGISIPIIKTLFDGSVKEKVLTILKGALIMYLLYKLADQIPEIASTITGGAELPSSEGDAMAIFKKVAGTTRSVQKRVGRAGLKVAKSAKDEAKESTVEDAGINKSEIAETKDSSNATSTAGNSGGEPHGAGDGGGSAGATGDGSGGSSGRVS